MFVKNISLIHKYADGEFLILSDGVESLPQMQANIKEGFLYEIDHTHLPPRTSTQLRSIRVAMART